MIPQTSDVPLYFRTCLFFSCFLHIRQNSLDLKRDSVKLTALPFSLILDISPTNLVLTVLYCDFLTLFLPFDLLKVGALFQIGSN